MDGNNWFRADKNGQQYFSSATNQCSIPGCVTATITIPVTGGYLGGVKVLAALSLRSTSLSPNLFAGLQQSGTITTTVIRYAYDPLGRLTNANYSTGESFAYAYDAVGNRTAQTATITSTQVTNYVYDAANRLANVNGQAYTWSDNGNLLNDGNTVYAYDQANRLISVTLGVTTTQYAYNGEGARLKQVVNGSLTTYTLDLNAPLVQVLAQKDSSGDTRYLYGMTRVGEQQSTGWVYHLSDALGSVRQLADANAKVTLARGYTPYGEALWSQGSGQSAYGFTGEALDVSTGLVYLRARYMDPGLGMFLSRDPWSGNAMRPGSMNGFGYGLGNPVNEVDPSGRCVGTDCGGDIVGQINQIENIYHVIVEPRPDTCFDASRFGGIPTSWSGNELNVLGEALNLTKDFLDSTLHPFDGAIGNRQYILERVSFTGQNNGTGTALVTGNNPVMTQVPDGGAGAGSVSALMHEFFHAFDYLTLVTPRIGNQYILSDDPAFNRGNKEHLYGGYSYDPKYELTPDDFAGTIYNPTSACGATHYACFNDRDNFADNAAVYALDWLSHHGDSRADTALNNFSNTDPSAPVRRVKEWTDFNIFGWSIRRLFFNKYFFGDIDNGL